MNCNCKRLLFWGVLAICCLGGAEGTLVAQNLIPMDPMVRTGKLANGFTYYIRHNGEPKNRVYIYLVNKVGSVLESDDQRGLAHFMEHMNFNGTRHFPKNDLVDYLQKVGLRFGADINAHTTFDETVYQLPLPSDKPDVIAKGIQIVRDWAQEALLEAGEIDKERGVVLEEERMGKGPGGRIQQQTLPIFLNGSRYAQRIPIGVDSILKNFKPEAIRRFYHDWYRPDLQAIVVVGDIDVDGMEKMIRQKFSDLKNPKHERPRTTYKVELSGADHFLEITDPELTNISLQMLIKHKGFAVRTDSDFVHKTEQDLFNQMLADRISLLNQQADVPFLNARAGIQNYLAGLNTFGVNIVFRSGQVERGVKALWSQVQMVKRFGFTMTELDRVRTRMLSQMKVLEKEKDKLSSATYAQAYEQYFLQGVGAPGVDWQYNFLTRMLPQISLAAINALATEFIQPANREILITGPEKEKDGLPDEKTVLGWLSAVEQGPLTPYKDEVNKLPLLSGTVGKGGSLVDRSWDAAEGLCRLTLSNGLKVILKPTTFSNEQIMLRAFAPGGTSVVPDEDFPSATMASSLISSGGAGNYDATQLSRYLTGKQVAVLPFIGERSEGFSGVTTTGDLETALQLIDAYFTEPRKDEAIFHNILSRTKEGLANRDNNPQSVFSDSVNEVLYGNNIRRMSMTGKMLDEVSLDKAYQFYKRCFADASGFTFTFVGKIDTSVVIPLLVKYLGALPSSHMPEKARDLGIRVPAGQLTKIVYKGLEDKATVNLLFSGDFDYTPQNLASLDALKEVLQIRVIQRLREEEGGVYSPGVQLNAVKYPQAWFGLTVRFTCAPANADKLVASVLDELAKLRTSGPSQENLDKWKAADLNLRETQLRNNGWWLGYITSQLENGEDIAAEKEHANIVNAITVPGLREAAARFFTGKNFIRLELRPEKK